MYCPECGELNKDDSLYCKKCGSPLSTMGELCEEITNRTIQQQLSADEFAVKECADVSNVDEAENETINSSRKKKALFATIGVGAIAFIVLAAYLIVGLTKNFKSNPHVEAYPQKEGIALFFEESQVLFGKESKLHLRIRVPSSSSSKTADNTETQQSPVSIKDERDNVLATIDSSMMKNTGDGYLWAETEINVPATETGSVKLYAGSEDGSGEETSEVILPVVRENVEVVPTGSEWLLAEVCDWTDENVSSMEEAAATADVLVKHLEEDDRILEVKRYGSTVMFTAKDTGILYCICLESLDTTMLGTAKDHEFSNDSTTLREFKAAGTDGKVASGNGITAGNAITNGNMLLLDPTPELMDKRASDDIRKACESSARLLDESRVTVAHGDDALRSLLRGDAYDAGFVIVRAHGIGGETPLFLMQTKQKSESSGWNSVQSSLSEYITSLKECGIKDPGSLFCGMASDTQTWRCAVTACVGEEKGTWNIGVSMAPGLLRNQYSSKPMDNCVIWLSVCGGLSDGSLNSWATERSYGVAALIGYEGSVSQAADARNLGDFLTKASSTSAKKAKWRCMDIGQIVAEMKDVVLAGNGSQFAKGTGTITGKLVNDKHEGVSGVVLSAWRYFNGAFKLQMEAKAGKDGAFKLEDLPSGRYVVEAKDNDEIVRMTVVLDEESIDGGELDMNTAPSRDAPAALEVSLGADNGSVAADAGYLYLGIGSNNVESGVRSKAKVVRVKRTDESDARIIWEAPSTGYVTGVLAAGDRLVVSFYTAEKSGTVTVVVNKLFVMDKDGSGAREVGSTVDAKNYGTPIAVDGVTLAYAVSRGDRWELCTCGLDGSVDSCVYAWEPRDAGSSLEVLGIADGNVYFYTSTSVASNPGEVAVGRVPVSGGDYAEVLRKSGATNPVLVGERLYFVEGCEYVSYSLSGGGREVVATLPAEVTGGYTWNASDRQAFVFGQAPTYDQSGVWRVDMRSGEAEKVGGYEQFASLAIVDDMLVASLIDDSKEVWDLGLRSLRRIWPAATSIAAPSPQPDPEPASVPAPSTEQEEQTADGAMRYLGAYEKVYDSGAAYGVFVSRQEGNTIDFEVSYAGKNGSPLYLTGTITTEVVNDEADFEWSDSWLNSGTGHLKFGDEDVTISMIQTVTAKLNKATLSTEGVGELVLPKVS